MSHWFSADPANNSFSIYGELGDLLGKSIWALPSGLVGKVQYYPQSHGLLAFVTSKPGQAHHYL